MDVELVLIVDEVQKVQRERYICFIAQIFHLSYAALFQEPIDKKKSSDALDVMFSIRVKFTMRI